MLLPIAANAQSTEDSTTPANVASFLDKTHVGGYGEFAYTRPDVGTPRLDVPRFVIYLDHYFSDKWAFKSETEIEHVKLERGAGGEVAIEQAFLDYHANPHINWRGGLVLIPMGIINLTHEPNTFYSVDRPLFDQIVIPSTWRELGTGIYGNLWEGVNYQAYVTEGLKADEITFEGMDGGKQEGSAGDLTSDEIAGSDASHPAGSVKLDFYPYTGFRLGLGVYYQPNAFANVQTTMQKALTMAVVDVRYEYGALRLRGEVGLVRLVDSVDLPGPSYISGGYAEVAVNVMSVFHQESELLPFARYERMTFYGRSPSSEGLVNPLPATERQDNNITAVAAGIAFKPLDNLIFKVDYRWISETVEDQRQFSVGFGYSF